MDDEVEESLVDDLLKKYLKEEREHTPEREARETLQQFVDNQRLRPALHEVEESLVDDLRQRALHKHEAIRVIKRLLAETARRPGVLAKALGYYRENTKDAEHRAMMRVLGHLHNDPLPARSSGGRPPLGRGHRVGVRGQTCMICKARVSKKKGWRADCPGDPPTRPANPPHRVRSQKRCAFDVAEAARKAGITNTKGKPIDCDAVLKMYNRWQRDGSPREREHERPRRRRRTRT